MTKKKFESLAAQSQYEQILKRPRGLVAAMWNSIAIQFFELKSFGLPNRFVKPEDVVMAIATSGPIADREINRFTVLRHAFDMNSASVLVDWDLTRICREHGAPHVPNPLTDYFPMAMALDKTRAAAVYARKEFSHIQTFKMPKPFVCVSAVSALPISDSDGNVVLAQHLQPEGFANLHLYDQIQIARQRLFEAAEKSEGCFFLAVEHIHPAAECAHFDFRLDMEPFRGEKIRNPLQDHLRFKAPWVKHMFDEIGPNRALPPEQLEAAMAKTVAAARQRLGLAGPMFSLNDIGRAGGPAACADDPDNDIVSVSGEEIPSVEAMTPFFKKELGVVYELMSKTALERAIAFPTLPINVETVGKVMMFYKGNESNTDVLRSVDVLFPDLPNCFLPRDQK